jgi:signal transduction histidine kinase
MNELTAFLQDNIIPIYFLYGLAHFITGFAVALEMGRTSQLQFSRAMPYLAAFALLHGTKEWLEMLSELSEQIPTIAREPEWGGIFKLGLMALSFFFLFQFGVRLIGYLDPERKWWLRRLPLFSVVLCLGGILFVYLYGREHTPEMQLRIADVWTRYSFGLPATITAALAMLVQRRAFLRENMPQFGRDLVGAALAFGWYAILDNVVVPRTPYFPSSLINSTAFVNVVGVPVQLLRAAVLSIFAFFMIRMLRVFDVEYARRLEAANRARFEAQEAATRELSVMFETCRTLGASLDVNQLINDALTKIVTLLDPMIAGSVYLYDQPDHALTLRACKMHRTQPPLSDAEIKVERRAASEAFDKSQIAYGSEAKTGTSFIAVPLVAQGRTVGALCLAHRAAFSNYAVIQTVAQHLGMALANAHLYTEVQDKEKLRGQLLERAVAAQEEERKRIARELHDEMGQMLTALGVGLGGVEQTMAQDTELARYQIAELKNMMMRAIDSLRQFISDLRPSVLDDMGLVAALRWIAQQYAERTGLAMNVEVIGAKRRLASQIETVLFRIAQEGLNNIARHARATRATVRLEFIDASVFLIIEDDGCGFSVDQVLGAHPTQRAWGLLGVQERVTLVGGKFKINSAPGQGTELIVQIPIATEEASDAPD